ncbi:MAG: hypothetical protein ACQESC_00490 [Nanobdellota archaeon]
MTQLIMFLSTGKGTWAQISRLIDQSSFDEYIIITNEFGYEKFSHKKPINKVVVNTKKDTLQLKEEIVNKLKPLVKGSQVGCNFVSGSGHEHMAFLSALLTLGVGIRLVMPGQNDFIEV